MKSNDEVDLVELSKMLWVNKWLIIILTLISSIFGVFYSLSLPNFYKSETILVVADSSADNSGFMQNYGSIARIAGINIPSQNSSNNALQAIEKLKTLSFFESNILPNIFLPDLMAFKSWNLKTNTSEYNDKIYINSSDKWIGGFFYNGKQNLKPSVQQSFSVFKKHLTLSIDETSSYVTLKVKHQSPYVAQEWSEILVDQINIYYRNKDRSEAIKSSNFLNASMAKAKSVEVREVIASLLMHETQKLSLIEAKEFYVYEYIDPPAVMEKKSDPNRTFICILFTLIGALLSIVYVLVRHYFFIKN